jgi:putative nucleotidyltransferase with HDIG domain
VSRAPTPGDFGALILAAGFSSRMGAFKPLLPLGEVSVVERVIHLFRTAGVAEICLVTGYRGGELGARLAGAGVILAENPHHADGMFSSIRSGMASVPAHCRGVFLLPVDIPLVRPATLHLLMAAFEGRAVADTVIHPLYAGRRGHPPLIPASLIPAILNHSGEGGLRALLEAPEARALEVPVPDRFILQDMDRPEDYEALKGGLATHPIPDAAECEVLLGSVRGAAPKVRRHSRLVAAAAAAIGRELVRAGEPLDLKLIQAGALLHDIAKGEKGHARAGAAYLRHLGFDRVAGIVAQHNDLEKDAATVDEAAVVFVADKYICGEAIVSLAQRFALALDRFGADPQARTGIYRRRAAARLVRDRIEALTGKSPGRIIRAALQGPKRPHAGERAS